MVATPSHRRDQRHQIVDLVLHPIERHHGEHEREDEQAHAVAHDVVAQQRRRDDARRELAAGDLNRDQQRPEREDQERHLQRNDGLVQRLGALHAEAHQIPLEPGIEHPENRHADQHGDDGEERHNPQGGTRVARHAVQPAPGEPAADLALRPAPARSDAADDVGHSRGRRHTYSFAEQEAATPMNAECSGKIVEACWGPIMECHDASAHLADYLSGSLPVEDVDALLSHAAACAACREHAHCF